MMNKKSLVSAVVVGLAFMSSSVFAQDGTCADPLPLVSHTEHSGTTCGGEIGINLGGTIFGHPSTVYSFVAEGATGNIVLSGTDREMALTTSCTSAPVPGAIGASGLPLSLDAANLQDGQTYLLVVSTDPSIDPTVPPICGDFMVRPDTLPVELQSFSVD